MWTVKQYMIMFFYYPLVSMLIIQFLYMRRFTVKNLNKLIPYIKHDLEKSDMTTFKIFLDKRNGKGYELLCKDGDVILFTIENLVKCRKAYEAVEYICEYHCLFIKQAEVDIYDYYMECQVKTLLEKGFICMNIISGCYKSKKAMNDAILAWLKEKDPNFSTFTLKEFAEYYEVPWFLEVR